MTGRRLLMMRLAVAVLSLLVSVAALEAVLRLYPFHDRFRESAIVTPRLSAPGEPELRIPRSDLAKSPDAFRILVVGDSYTFGDGVHVEDAYPQRLAARLRVVRPDLLADVLAWSRRGWNTDQELRSVGPHMDRLDPDLLILGFSLNDTEMPCATRFSRAIPRADSVGSYGTGAPFIELSGRVSRTCGYAPS